MTTARSLRRLALLLGSWALGVSASPPPADVALYRHWCARCHGERGDGKGPAAPALALNGHPPRDFISGRFKFKSTRAAEPPTDADLARVISEGLPGTSMPYFKDLFDAEAIGRLVGVVRSFAAHPLPPGAPLNLGAPVSDDGEVRRRGAALYTDLGCPDCHGVAGDGRGPSAPSLRNADGSRAVPADLTRPWTFRGGADALQITMRLATGIDGTPMPSYLGTAAVADLWAVAHHVRSLARAPSVEAAALERAQRPPGDGEALRERGEYVVKSGTCFLCHVQMNPDGSYTEGSFGAGGMRIEIARVATVFSRNLTPDPDTGLGGWTADDVRRALREGRSRDGRRLAPLDMPWTVLAGLTDRDLAAVHAYLQSLPAVRNLVPAPAAPDVYEATMGKLGALLRGEKTKAGFFPGNAGRAPDPAERAAPVRNPRGERLVLLAAAAGILASLVLRYRRALVIAGLGVGVAVLYTWPPLMLMPTAMLRAEPPFGFLNRTKLLPPVLPPPDPAPDVAGDVRVLAARGQYVATIGTCSLCHTAGVDLSRPWKPFPEMGGGLEVNWKVFGTTYSRNLTPDRETGLGGWSTAEIRRAITSGIARDGRLMHWQAMPWDHFSNLTPEDLEALVVYLQHLPPVHSRVPGQAPPRSDDEDADTFYFGYVGEYCEP